MLPPSTYRRRRLRLVLAAAGILAGILAGVGVVIAGYIALVSLVSPLRPPVRPLHPMPKSAPIKASASPIRPACPTAELADAARLGEVAWINDGTLQVIDLGTCRRAVLVSAGAAPPVRFSPDGRWLAFGEGSVVPASGGSMQEPFGSPVEAWEWSPVTDVLAGVTREGGLLIARPGSGPEAVLPKGGRIGHLAFSPDGRRLAVDWVGRGIQVLHVSTAGASTVLSEPDPAKVPEVAGWSPDGRWVLYWRGPVRKDGVALDAVPLSGGPWVNLFDPVLPNRDFVAPCGTQIALSVGAGLSVSAGKQIVLTGPPGWSFHDLTDDFSRSWFWPACSPDGRWLAVTDSFNQKESANQAIPRALWLLASNGSSRRLLVPGSRTESPEFPRWSSDGTVILVVMRSGPRWSSPGSLLLVQVDPRSGKLVKRVGPIADLGAAPGPGGHQEWAAISDWYRP